MPRFNVKHVNFAAKKARELKAVAEGRSLTACQQAYAFMIGYSGWAELAEQVKRERHAASPLNEDVSAAERTRREDYHADRLSALWSISREEALSLVRIVCPTGPTSAKSKPSYDSAADFGMPNNQSMPDKESGSVFDSIYAAVRKPMIDEEERRLHDIAVKMPSRTDEDRVSKAIFLNMAFKKMDVLKYGVGYEDYAYRLDELVRRFLVICIDSKDFNSAWMKLSDVAYDLHTAGERTEESLCYDAMNVLEKAFESVLGIKIEKETPEERALRYLGW